MNFTENLKSYTFFRTFYSGMDNIMGMEMKDKLFADFGST